MRCARFFFQVMPAIFRLHAFLDFSFDSSGKLMEIGLIAGCNVFTGVPGRNKFPVAPVSNMASCLDICHTYVEYAVFICLRVRLFMMIVFSSSSSLIASR